MESDITCPFCENEKNSPNGPMLLHVLRESNSKREFVSNYWHCKTCKSVWRTESEEMIPVQTDCIECMVLSDLNDLQENDTYKPSTLLEEFPNLAEEWDEDNVLPSSEVISTFPLRVTWKCSKCQLKWRSLLIERFDNKKTCPYCSEKLPIPGKNSLLALHPDLMEEWAYNCNTDVDPDKIFPHNRFSVRWKCKDCQIIYTVSARARTQRMVGCPNCNSDNPVPRERYDLLASEFYLSYGKISELERMVPIYTAQILWKCINCSNIFQLSYKERFYDHKDCLCREGKKAIPGKTSFKAMHPDLMAEWKCISNHYLVNPDLITEKYSKDVWWLCSKCKTTYKMSPQRRLYFQKRKMNSCSYCKGRRQKKIHFF